MTSTSETITPGTEATGASATAHAPSLAGSVIEAKDGMGGSNFIRIQNMSATGTFVRYRCLNVLSSLTFHPYISLNNAKLKP